jgi:hypothetical protein
MNAIIDMNAINIAINGDVRNINLMINGNAINIPDAIAGNISDAAAFAIRNAGAKNRTAAVRNLIRHLIRDGERYKACPLAELILDKYKEFGLEDIYGKLKPSIARFAIYYYAPKAGILRQIAPGTFIAA